MLRPPRPGGPNPILDPDLLLPHCWRLQDCSSCLETKYHCSWCATSSVCVPNPVTWPVLAPIWNRDVCPTRDERWEMRGNELGCSVSTTTVLSVVVTVFATLGVLVLGWAVRLAWAWGMRKRKAWMVWWKDLTGVTRVWFKNWWARLGRLWRRQKDSGSVDESSRLLG